MEESTWKTSEDAKASAVSGVGTGLSPAGGRAQSPSLLMISAPCFGRGGTKGGFAAGFGKIMMGLTGGGGGAIGMSCLFLLGAVTRTGGGKVSIVSRPTSCGIGTANTSPARAERTRADLIFVTRGIKYAS